MFLASTALGDETKEHVRVDLAGFLQPIALVTPVL